MLPLREQEHVLGVERWHRSLVPEAKPDAVDDLEPATREAGDPVVGPLLVDMADALLVRDRSGEQDDWSERREVRHEAGGERFAKVLGDFE